MGAAVAAVILRKEKEIVAAFRRTGATSAGKSVSPSDVGVDERLPFELLRRRQVLRETQPGRFYLDEPRWETMRRRRHILAFVVLVVLLVLAVVVSFMVAKPAH